jgi:methionine-rich copper-binding protein CopC
MKTYATLALGLALSLTAAAAAEAHAKLVKADPPANGAAKAPQSIDLTFSEKISGNLSGAVVKGADGKPIAGSAMTDNGGKGLMVMLKQPLKPGAYSVAWHAVASDDGHRTTGAYTFTAR